MAKTLFDHIVSNKRAHATHARWFQRFEPGAMPFESCELATDGIRLVVRRTAIPTTAEPVITFGNMAPSVCHIWPSRSNATVYLAPHAVEMIQGLADYYGTVGYAGRSKKSGNDLDVSIRGSASEPGLSITLKGPNGTVRADIADVAPTASLEISLNLVYLSQALHKNGSTVHYGLDAMDCVVITSTADPDQQSVLCPINAPKS